ncbi:hypothetical protein EZJ55_20115 [Microcystis aeruginosa EAWAG127a]|uniref:Uncharacterized protein n=1 Tax=Microcystis aeruginosa EAWAG127a TaxID=2529855 RepID=A0A5J5LZI7_MICAE|nr:hypothetical protein [Microcystis aeruginosa]KAB0242506.1 hypothetical protein EZJ55_20115 [Microcystis aeruginosa EAWAG127a]
MASIKIDSDLRPIGSELFLDSESYLDELSADQQINNIVGGTNPTFTRPTRPTTIRPTITFPTTFPTTSPVINPVSVVIG